MRIYLAAPAILALVACTSQAQMDKAQTQRVTRIGLNYQQVYANLNKGARNCFAVNSTGNVDAQLYPDLGYGEVTAATKSSVSYSPLLYAKVSAEGEGAVLQSKSLMAAGREGSLNWVDYWAKGGIRCPGIHYGEAPPRS